MKDYKVIGKPVIKKDVKEKVKGIAKFAGDIQMEGMLYAKLLRSTVPHGILKAIDVSKARALPGVHAVLTAKDVPGANSVGMIIKDEPVLVSINEKVRKVGDPLALVGAESEEIAEKALALIDVTIEDLPGVFCPLEAMKEDAPKIHEKGNILATRRIIKGDIDRGFTNSEIIIEEEYRTPMVEHVYIETEVGVAKYEDDIVTLWVSTQNPHYDQRDVARNLNVGLNKVSIIQTVTGGGFGGKLDVSVHVYIALLAMVTKRPVKMVYSRNESIISSVKRHAMVIKMKTGADGQGKLLALDCEIIGDTGAYASYGPGTLTRSAVHVSGPYEIPNVRIVSLAVYTNNPQAGAMRGFGVPAVAFAHESQMDILAQKVGISPLKVRLINAFKPGTHTATGSELKQSVGIIPTLKTASKKAADVMNFNLHNGEV